MLALTDVKDACASKHKCAACDALRNKRTISKRMQAVFFGAGGERFDRRVSENERGALLSTKDYGSGW